MSWLTLALVLGAVGAVLVLVAAVGGGVTVWQLVIPRVGFVPRMASAILGSLLVISSILVTVIQTPVLTTDQHDQVQAQGQQQPPPQQGQQQPPQQGQQQPQQQPAQRQQSQPEPVVAPIMAPVGYDIYLYATPSTSASTLAQLPDGHAVTIVCTMQGEAVTSSLDGVTSSLWDGVSAGSDGAGGHMTGFVPDVYVGTPSYQPTMPNCGSLNSDGTRA
jgi:hypothetical protein